MRYKRDTCKLTKNMDFENIFGEIYCKFCGKKIFDIDKYLWVELIELEFDEDVHFQNTYNMTQHDLHTLYDLLHKRRESSTKINPKIKKKTTIDKSETNPIKEGIVAAKRDARIKSRRKRKEALRRLAGRD